jgi:hypothetical protein
LTTRLSGHQQSNHQQYLAYRRSDAPKYPHSVYQ